MPNDDPFFDERDAVKAYDNYKQTKDPKYASEFVKSIEGRYLHYDFEIDDIEFLLLQVNNKPVIWHIMDNRINLDIKSLDTLASKASNVKKLIDCGYVLIANYVEGNILYKRVEGDKTLFDYLIEKRCLNKNIVRTITVLKPGYANKLARYDKKLLCYLNEDILFSKGQGTKSLIEHLIEKNLFPTNQMYTIRSHPEIVDICLKHNKKTLLSHLDEKLLSMKRGKTNVLDFLLKNGVTPLCVFTDLKCINTLFENNRYDILIHLDEDTLLKERKNGKTILEELLELKTTPKIKEFKKLGSLKILSKYERIDLMLNVDLGLLLDQKDLNLTYLDELCNGIVFDRPYRLLKLKWPELSNKKACRFLMIIAKHHLREYIRPVTPDRLIKKKGGTKLLDDLLDIDSNLTINRIIPSRVLEDISVALHLRLRGLEQDKVNVTLYSKDMAGDYSKKSASQFEHLPLDEESQKIIKELRSIMTKDGESKPELVDLFITSYEFLLFVNPEIGKQEVRKIIEIKSKTGKFAIVESDKDRSEFIAKDNTIYMNNPTIPVINHEMGHFFFSNLTNRKVPSEFYEIIEKLRNSEGFIDKVQEYGRKVRELVFSIQEMVEEKYMGDYDRSITASEKERIKELIEVEKEKVRSKYSKSKYDKKSLEEVLDKTYNVEEYLKQERRIQKNRLVYTILRCDFGAFRAIGDMLDAIYGGAIFSNELLYRDGVPALRATGHGIAYYRSKSTNMFEESLSQFLLIIKSVDSKEVISYMHDLFGDNYLNFFFDYYLNQLLKLEETKQETEGRKI